MSFNFNSDDEALFLRHINQKGFFLEDKTWKLLYENLSAFELSRNKIIDYHDERVEIDFVVSMGLSTFIVECKKTDFTWVFSKALERMGSFHLINDSSKGMKVKTIVADSLPSDKAIFFRNTKCSWFDINILLNENNRLVTKRSEGNPVLKTNQQEVHDHVRQVLKETQAFLNTLSSTEERKLDRIPRIFYLPIIVTNAKLLYLDYTKGNLDSSGNLTQIPPLVECDYVAYNFAEVMKWDDETQTIKDQDGLDGGPTHTKTVFIVNINHLIDFMNKMSEFTQIIDFTIFGK